MNTNKLAILLIAFFSLFCTSQLKAQATHTVCTSGCNFTTIQAAMTAAASGDTIFLNVNGAFTEKNIVIPEKNIILKGLGKSTTILQSASTRASASGGRMFSYLTPTGAGNNSFLVSDMTIRYAIAPLTDIAGGGQYQSLGGVLYSTAPKGFKVTFDHVKLYANETTAGNVNNSGGACFYISATGTGYTYNAELTMTNCDFDDNKVGNSSGSSLSDGSCFNLLGNGNVGKLTVANCTFTNNSGYTRGGILYAGSNWTVDFSNSSFENNTCRNGDGGCFHATSGLSYKFRNCLFKNNSAVYLSPVNGNNGWGGVYRGKGAIFNNCTFFNNSAIKGGAIYRNNSAATQEMQIINCTFSGNAASVAGRAIHYGSGASANAYPLTLINSIFTNGSGAASGDIHFVLPYSQLGTNLKNYCNSITSENATPGAVPIFEFTSGNTTLGLGASPASNGGAIQSLALTNASTLINAGTNITGATYDIATKDQRDFSRHDGAIDVGSFEYSGISDDAAKPVISYTALDNTMATTDRSFSVSITDANGVYWYPQSTDLRPRIYFRKNNGGWISAVGTLSSGNGLNGSWTFTISSTAMGGVTNGDQVEYFVLAQDVSTDVNIVSSPANVVATSVMDVTVPPAAQSYIIGAALPVKLTNFTAKANNTSVVLDWAVSEQINVAFYSLERSKSGSVWNTIGSVPATSSKKYQYIDPALASGTYYYRLKVTDQDGKFTYSDSRVTNISNSHTSFSIVGSKVSNGLLQVEIHRKTALYLFDTNGKLVWTKQFVPGVQQIDMSTYAKGIYFIKDNGSAEKIQLQ